MYQYVDSANLDFRRQYGGKSMKQLYFFVAIFFLVGGLFSVNAQDLIVLRDGNMIEAKVVEISSAEIRYRRFDHLDGPIIVISSANVLSIRYENGTSEIVNPTPVSPESNADRNPSKNQEYIELFPNRYFFLGGGISFQHRSINYYENNWYNDDYSLIAFRLSPIFGFQYTKFGFGFNPIFQYNVYSDSSYSSSRSIFGIGIFAQYNFYTIQRFSILGKFSIDYLSSPIVSDGYYDSSNSSGNSFGIGISPIFQYRLLEKLSLFASIGSISYTFSDDETDYNKEQYSTGTFGFNISSNISFGFNVLFPFKPKESESDSKSPDATDNTELQSSTAQEKEQTGRNTRFNTIGGTVGYLGVSNFGFSLNGTVSPASYTFFDFSIGLGFANFSFNGHINFCGFVPFNNGGWYGGLGIGGGAYELVDSMEGYFAINVITGFVFFNWLNISATLQMAVAPEFDIRFKPMVGYVYRFKPRQ